jgi:hypothetical protein
LDARGPAAGGFNGPVTIATTGDYFDLFVENGLDPDPEAATTSGDLLIWEFGAAARRRAHRDVRRQTRARVAPSTLGGDVRPRRLGSCRVRSLLDGGDALMEIILRATAIYLFIYLVIRVMGKRELGEMSAFELILLVMIGDLVQQAVTQEDYSVTGAVLAVGTIAFWVVVSSYASFRWKRASRVLAENSGLLTGY